MVRDARAGKGVDEYGTIVQDGKQCARYIYRYGLQVHDLGV